MHLSVWSKKIIKPSRGNITWKQVNMKRKIIDKVIWQFHNVLYISLATKWPLAIWFLLFYCNDTEDEMDFNQLIFWYLYMIDYLVNNFVFGSSKT